MFMLFIVVVALAIGMIAGYAVTIAGLNERIELRAYKKLSRSDHAKLVALLKKLQ